MNKFIGLILSSILSVSSIGQVTFENRYISSTPVHSIESNVGSYDLEIPDGYLIFFNQDYGFLNSGAFKIDKNGNYLWAKQIKNISEEFF